MNKLILLLSLFLNTTTFSQTKLVAFKSHSGNTKKFVKSLQSELFNSPNSNFGIPTKKTLTNDEKKSISKDVADKTINVSYETEKKTSEQTIEIILTNIPKSNFKIYLNQKLITTQKKYSASTPLKVTLEKGKRNYLVFDNTEKKNNKSEGIIPIYITVKVLGSEYQLWSNNTTSRAIIIDQIDK